MVQDLFVSPVFANEGRILGHVDYRQQPRVIGDRKRLIGALHSHLAARRLASGPRAICTYDARFATGNLAKTRATTEIIRMAGALQTSRLRPARQFGSRWPTAAGWRREGSSPQRDAAFSKRVRSR